MAIPEIIPTALIDTLRTCRRVAVFTGAGMSAESGIPTFRDAQTGLWIQLTHHGEFADHQHDLGYQERNRHVEQIQAGAPCFMVMCEARDLKRFPVRSIVSTTGSCFVEENFR